MKTRKIFVIMLGIAGSLFLIQACKKDVISGQAPVSTGTAAIRVKLTDAPANYLQVNVDIKQVRIHISADSNSTDGWIDLPTNAGIYNLLELRNGIDTTLVDSTLIPAGKVSQIRFVLGPNSSVMTADSVLHAVTQKKEDIVTVLDRIEGHYGGIIGYLSGSGFDVSKTDKLRDMLAEK